MTPVAGQRLRHGRQSSAFLRTPTRSVTRATMNPGDEVVNPRRPLGSYSIGGRCCVRERHGPVYRLSCESLGAERLLLMLAL